jgi:Protein of unknown function (DUF3617)
MKRGFPTMNTRYLKVGAFSLFLTFFAAIHSVQAQTMEPPPLKMGLWQMESTTSVAGMENMPMGHAASQHSTVTQSCLTPDSWKNDFEKMTNPTSNCTPKNVHQDSHSITADLICNSERYSSNAHFEGLFDSDEHVHGTATSHITAQGMPQSITMQMSFTSHYLSASCGDVKPGEGKVVSRQ